jgi:hypothetical protein
MNLISPNPNFSHFMQSTFPERSQFFDNHHELGTALGQSFSPEQQPCKEINSHPMALQKVKNRVFTHELLW